MNKNILKIGSGKIADVKSTLMEYGISGRLLYVMDPYVDSIYGPAVRDQLSAIGVVTEQPVTHNTIQYAMETATNIIESDVDCVIAMGGGKTLDVGKYAAFMTKRPFLSIPTTVSHDGIVSPIAVLKRDDGKPKSLGCKMPSMIVLDTDIISTCPIQLIKAGIGDTISNYMALIDWDLAVMRGKDEMNGYAYMMSRTSLDALMKTQYDTICEGFIELLVNCLVLSGIAMDFAGSSRPVSGSEHLFSHALDYFGDNQTLHGLNVALGTIAVLKIVNKDTSEVVQYLQRFDVNVNPQKMGISEDLFVHCIRHAKEMRNNRYTYLNEADLAEPRLRTIYKELIEEL